MADTYVSSSIFPSEQPYDSSQAEGLFQVLTLSF